MESAKQIRFPAFRYECPNTQRFSAGKETRSLRLRLFPHEVSPLPGGNESLVARVKRCLLALCLLLVLRNEFSGAPGEIRTPDLMLRRHHCTRNQELSHICPELHRSVSIRPRSGNNTAENKQAQRAI